MKNREYWQNRLACVTVLALLGLAGCQQPVSEKRDTGPVFFPPPPSQPRLQFLTSYSGKEVSSTTKRSFLETYVLGDTSTVPQGVIAQPYGLAIHNGKIYVCDVGTNNIKVIDIVQQLSLIHI